MSLTNGLAEHCALSGYTERIRGSMQRSEETHANITLIKSKVDQLDRLSDIAAALKSINRNNTILLIILGLILVLHEFRDTGGMIKASGFGSSVEVSHGAPK